MSDANEFLKAMKSVETKPRGNEEALKVLDEFREAVKAFTTDKVELSRERGYLTNFGQEWRFRLKKAGADSEPMTTLFRAHVPRQGTVYLDLDGEEMKGCDNPEEIKKALKHFIQEASVVETLALLSED